MLISLDVAGAFDKVWWKALLANLKHCGMSGKALGLLNSYLSKRKFRVVANGIASALVEYFAGVPQGGIWSPKLWNFHIRELAQVVVDSMLMKYADDSALLKVIQTIADRRMAVAEVDRDLESIVEWGKLWKVAFEPKKTHAMLCTRKKPGGMPQPIMDGKKIGSVSNMKLVGFTIDSKLNWQKMACSAASRGKSMLGALYRMQSLLKPSDLQDVYKSFVRSKMEFGSIEYIAAAPTHLAKIDRVQRTAERMCGCKFDSLSGRREAAVFALVCKLLDQECVSPLQKFCPEILSKVEGVEVKTRQQIKVAKDTSLKLKSKTNKLRNFSLLNYKWSWLGQAGEVFDKLPSDLKAKGMETSWMKVKSEGKEILNGSAERKNSGRQKKKKLNHKNQQPVHTGSTLNNELNVNLVNWKEYAAIWNANKTH